MNKNNQLTPSKPIHKERKSFHTSSPKRTEAQQLGKVSRNMHPEPSQKKRIQNATQQQNRPRSCLSRQASKSHQDDFQVYLDDIVKDLSDKKEKLESCIKYFNMMQSHNAQLRCIQHSNVLTIYCQTERKALCANCVYGASRHRTHRLIPLKDAIEFIIEDNTLLWKIIDTDMKRMDESIRNTQQNTVILEKEYKKSLTEIEEEYSQRMNELKVNYAWKKRKMTEQFQGMIQKSRNVQKGIEQFKFKVWETLSKVGIGKRSEGSNSEIEVSRQVLCVSMSEITSISVKQITKREIQKFSQLVAVKY